MSKEATINQVPATKSLPVSTSGGSLESYLTWVNSHPILTREEEQDLTKKLAETGDVRAAEKLVSSHLRYVVHVAKRYMGYGLQLGDLIQEGTVGLMKAVKRFEPQRGVRLVTFAMHWIKAEMHEYIIKNFRMVKVATTKAQRKLFFNLRQSKPADNWLSQDDVHTMAQDLGVKPEEVREMEKRMYSSDLSFNLPEAEDQEGPLALPAPEQVLTNPEDNPALLLENANWQQHAWDKLQQTLETLDERSQIILKNRWLVTETTEKATLTDLAKQFNISTERVRQLEQQAIQRLRAEFECA